MINKQSFSTNKRGQSIIEVLIAFGVIVVLGIALVSAGLLTQRTSISARNNTQATKLVQGYLEQVRVIRDIVGYTAFKNAYSDATCYVVANSTGSDPSLWSLSPSCTGTAPLNGEIVTFNNVSFFRKVTLANTTSTNRDVNVTVTWKEGVNDRVITANTVLSKWCEGTITGLAGSTCAL